MIDRNIVLMHHIFMLIPKEGSKRAEILRTVIENGGLSIKEIEEIFGRFGFTRPARMKAALQDLVINRCLKVIDGVYYPIGEVIPKSKRDNVAEPKTVDFKPLKTFLPKVSPRGQVIEERSFKTCTSNIKDSFFRNESVPKL